MAQFSVNVETLRNASVSFKGYSEKINAISTEAGSILKNTKTSVNSWIVDLATDYYIKKSVEACAKDMEKLSIKSSEIADLYSQGERNVQNKDFILSKGFSNDGFVDLDNYDLTEVFFDERNPKSDAIIFALSRGLTDGVKSLINKNTGGDDFNDEIFKDTIMRMINSIETPKIDLSGLVDVVGGINTYAGNGISATDDILEMMNKKGLGDALGGIGGATLNNLGDLLTMGESGIELAELYLNDYAKTITALQKMKEGLVQVNGSEKTINYINQLIDSYNNKFATTVQKVKSTAVDIGVDKTLEATVGTVTGGLFTVADAAHGIVWDVTGVSKKGDSLGSAYASDHYSDDLILAYDYYAQKLQSGNYTENDVEMCKTMFEMAKQSRINEYTYIKNLVDKDDKTILDNEIGKLEGLKWNSDAKQ